MGKIKARFRQHGFAALKDYDIAHEFADLRESFVRDPSMVMSLADQRRLTRPEQPRRTLMTRLGELVGPRFDGGQTGRGKGATADRMKRLLEKEGFAPELVETTAKGSMAFSCTLADGEGPFQVMLLGREDNGAFRSMGLYCALGGRTYSAADANRLNRDVWAVKYYTNDDGALIPGMELSLRELSDAAITDVLLGWFAGVMITLENING